MEVEKNQSETGHSPPPMIDTKPLPRQKLGNLSKSHPPPVYRWAWHYMAWSIFSLFGSPAWLYPSQYLVPPPQSLWGDRHQAKWEREKVLMLCKHCSARAEYQCVINTVLVTKNTAPQQLLWRKLTLSQSDPVQGEKKNGCFLHGKQMPDFKKAEYLFIRKVLSPNIWLPDHFQLDLHTCWCFWLMQQRPNIIPEQQTQFFIISPVISQYSLQNMLEELFNRLQEMTIPQYGFWKQPPDKCHKETALEGSYLTLFSSMVSVLSTSAQMSQHCHK